VTGNSGLAAPVCPGGPGAGNMARSIGCHGVGAYEEETVTTLSTSVSIGKKPAPVTLSDEAMSQLAQLLAEEGDENLALRVAVKPGGCSGYSYEMFFDTEVMPDDVVREFGAVRVVVDSASAELLTGSTLDYTGGLQGAGFHITNPNATRTCGCGSSFS
jgi:iron-sulfur cluster assembly accessory protein